MEDLHVVQGPDISGREWWGKWAVPDCCRHLSSWVGGVEVTEVRVLAATCARVEQRVRRRAADLLLVEIRAGLDAILGVGNAHVLIEARPVRLHNRGSLGVCGGNRSTNASSLARGRRRGSPEKFRPEVRGWKLSVVGLKIIVNIAFGNCTLQSMQNNDITPQRKHMLGHARVHLARNEIRDRKGPQYHYYADEPRFLCSEICKNLI